MRGLRSIHRLAAALLLASGAAGQVVQLPFSGRVTGITVLAQPPPSIQVAVGDPVVGVAGIDLAAANVLVALGNTTVYTHPDDGMRIVARIGSHVWAVNRSGTSSVKDDHPVDGDLLALGASNFGGLPFPGAANGSITLRWQDAAAPYALLGAAALPASVDLFDPSAATTATGVLSGGSWTVRFELEVAPVELLSVDDTDPAAPRIVFQVRQPTTATEVTFAGTSQALGPLGIGLHSATVAAPPSLAPDRHELTVRSTTAAGASVATAVLDTSYLPEVTDCDSWVVFVVNIGTRAVKLCPRVELRRWEWDLEGARHARLVERVSVTVTSSLDADVTIPGGNPTLRHNLGLSLQAGSATVPLAAVPGIGANVFWSASFAANVSLFLPRKARLEFTATGSTSMPGGLALWNLGLPHGFTVQLP